MSLVERLFLENASRIYRLAYHYLGDATAAEDATQDTFVRALEKQKDFRQQADPATWLYRIAVNLCIDHLRGKKRARTETLDNAIQEPSRSEDPSQKIERAASVKMVNNLLDALPEYLRLLVILREFEEMPYQEIAHITGLSIGTISSRLNRARQEIYRQIKGRTEKQR